MIDWKHPLGSRPLLATLISLFILTAMLVSMVYGRVHILQTGKEVLLRTAPVDPRDLLRGYYVQLSYDIASLVPGELPESDPNVVGNGFFPEQRLYVRLRPDAKGFWKPVGIFRSLPEDSPGSAIISGRVTSNACLKVWQRNYECRVGLNYGIEKFFAPQQRAKELENFRFGTSPEVEKLDAERNKLQSELTDADRRDPEKLKRYYDKVSELDNKRAEIIAREQQNMAERFAVVVRVSQSSGEAAISGLQLDGKRIYEEPVF